MNSHSNTTTPFAAAQQQHQEYDIGNDGADDDILVDEADHAAAAAALGLPSPLIAAAPAPTALTAEEANNYLADNNTTNNCSSTGKRGYPLFLDTREKLRIAKVYIKLLIAKHEDHHHPNTKTGAASHKTSGIGCRQLAKACGVGKTTANKIMNELKEHGGILDKARFRNAENKGEQHAKALRRLFRDADRGLLVGKTFAGKLTVKEYQEEFERRSGGEKISYDIMRQQLNDYKLRKKERGVAPAKKSSPTNEQVHVPCVDGNGQILYPPSYYDQSDDDDDDDEEEEGEESLQEKSNDDEGDNEADWAKEEEENFLAPEDDTVTLTIPSERNKVDAQPLKKRKLSRVSVPNAIDLTSSAFNALHQDQVSVAVQRLKLALQELGQHVTLTNSNDQERAENHLVDGDNDPEFDDDADFDDDDDGT